MNASFRGLVVALALPLSLPLFAADSIWVLKEASTTGRKLAEGKLETGAGTVDFKDQENGITKQIPFESLSSIEISVRTWDAADPSKALCTKVMRMVTLILNTGERIRGCKDYAWNIATPDGVRTRVDNINRDVIVQRRQ